MKKLAVSFRGGLARGFASVGAMGAFQDAGIQPHIFAGSSSGSVIASAFALNLNWEEVLRYLEEFRFTQSISVKSFFTEFSLVSSQKLKHFYIEHFQQFVNM